MKMHRSCMLPSNAPALSTPEPASNRVLQERSGNRTSIESSQSPPYRPKVYRQRLGEFGSTILAPPLGCRTEEEVDYEFRKVWAILQNHPKYQKYREKKPKEGDKKDEDEDLEKWPEFLDRAFFRALIRWPPSGRVQYVVDGEKQGRNQLISRSIFLKTGVMRWKKQISSHIQVLRPKLLDAPQVVRHFSKPGKTKKGSARERANQVRNRQLSYSVKRDEDRMDDTTATLYGGYRLELPASSPYAVRTEAKAPFTMMHFEMLVQEHNEQAVHYVTQLGDDPRLGDVHFPDLNTWNMQYPELNFHRVSEWRDRQVLICHASIDLMMDKQPGGAELAVKYVIDSAHDISHLEPMHCRTRFYDSGTLAYEEERRCEYATNTRSNLHFGSQFWVRRMSDLRMKLLKGQRHDDPGVARKMEKEVQRSLQYMTAVQDVYGTRGDLGMQQCLLTILWRFRQTRTRHEMGRVSWRVAYLPQEEGGGTVGQEGEQLEPDHQQPMWDKAAGLGGPDFEVPHDLKLILNSTATPGSTIYNASSLSLDLSQAQQHHHVTHHLQQHDFTALAPLDLDTLSHLATLSTHPNPNDPLAGFPSHPDSAATVHSLASTEFSQALSHVPSLTHSSHTQMSQDSAVAAAGGGESGDIDFHDPGAVRLDVRLHEGHIQLGPAISFDDGIAVGGTYDEVTDAAGMQLEPGILHAHDGSVSAAAAEAVFGDLQLDGIGALVAAGRGGGLHVGDVTATAAGYRDQEFSMGECYPSAPSVSKPWCYADLIARMEESAAAADGQGQGQNLYAQMKYPDLEHAHGHGHGQGHGHGHGEEMDINVVGPAIGLHHSPHEHRHSHPHSLLPSQSQHHGPYQHQHQHQHQPQHQPQHPEHSLWKLQTGFSVAGAEQDDIQHYQRRRQEEVAEREEEEEEETRREQQARGILEMIERSQRGEGGLFR
ncbi:uncharacterized protein EI97DRAFT_304664 [Westerdykella ornata]|uniref:TEA domain-containing protein n=1 Tax=Westerdykella ornata TaxID=318751 RepID=A0A6A6JKD4_WESOR|nr:uncharacterized protein EI97DRAFT_304664 [Westerdykella ornata]KAF2276967.1 hypothetical protein EI97DRAFT_304664 [Westerdykella ornata]